VIEKRYDAIDWLDWAAQYLGIPAKAVAALHPTYTKCEHAQQEKAHTECEHTHQECQYQDVLNNMPRQAQQVRDKLHLQNHLLSR